MGLLHYVSGNGFGHSKEKKNSCLFKVVFECLDSAVELVFLLFDRLHIYHASVLVRYKGYMYFLCYVKYQSYQYVCMVLKDAKLVPP